MDKSINKELTKELKEIINDLESGKRYVDRCWYDKYDGDMSFEIKPRIVETTIIAKRQESGYTKDIKAINEIAKSEVTQALKILDYHGFEININTEKVNIYNGDC